MSSNIPQRLREFLATNGGTATLDSLCKLAFAAHTSPDLARRLLLAALPGELQFTGDTVAWLPQATATDDIDTARFIVVDLETTGTHPDYAEILEFGAVFVEKGKIAGEEHGLFKPQKSIPPFITQLTGIDDAMVADALPFTAHAERLHHLFQGAIPVAHNAEFDYRFLDAAFTKLGMAEVGVNRLCTIKMGRVLVPSRRYNLDALAETLQVSVSQRHRALGDARVTAHILIEILNRAKQQGIQSVRALRNLKQKRGRGAEAKLQVGADRIRAIPERPGVYRFRSATGEVIYVGKALSLRNRLGSYFVGSKKGKTSRMLAEVRDFDYTVAGSELEALLEEAKEIRTRQPKYNRALRTFGRYGYLRWSKTDAFPILRFASDPGDAERFENHGPFRMRVSGRHEIKALRETFKLRNCQGALKPDVNATPCMELDFGRCSAPCAGLEDENGYAQQIEKLKGFLKGDSSVLKQIRSALDVASRSEQFEKAAALRDRYRILSALHLYVRREEQWLAQGDRWALVPAAEEELVRLYWLRPGGPLAAFRFHLKTPWEQLSEKLRATPASGLASIEDGRIAEGWLRRKPAIPTVRLADFSDFNAAVRAAAAICQSGEWRTAIDEKKTVPVV